jgi:hypothetical protein
MSTDKDFSTKNMQVICTERYPNLEPGFREVKFRAIIPSEMTAEPFAIFVTIYFDFKYLCSYQTSYEYNLLIRWLHQGNEPDPYIGMKDKNGKEIYEGDIISTPYYTLDDNGKENTEWITCDVFYCEESLGFIVNPPGGRIVEIKPGCEVLGNIYENRELIDA